MNATSRELKVYFKTELGTNKCLTVKDIAEYDGVKYKDDDLVQIFSGLCSPTSIFMELRNATLIAMKIVEKAETKLLVS